MDQSIGREDLATIFRPVDQLRSHQDTRNFRIDRLVSYSVARLHKFNPGTIQKQYWKTGRK